jgi:hypothetical protein
MKKDPHFLLAKDSKNEVQIFAIFCKATDILKNYYTLQVCILVATTAPILFFNYVNSSQIFLNIFC